MTDDLTIQYADIVEHSELGEVVVDDISTRITEVVDSQTAVEQFVIEFSENPDSMFGQSYEALYSNFVDDVDEVIDRTEFSKHWER